MTSGSGGEDENIFSIFERKLFPKTMVDEWVEVNVRACVGKRNEGGESWGLVLPYKYEERDAKARDHGCDRTSNRERYNRPLGNRV